DVAAAVLQAGRLVVLVDRLDGRADVARDDGDPGQEGLWAAERWRPGGRRRRRLLLSGCVVLGQRLRRRHVLALELAAALDLPDELEGLGDVDRGDYGPRGGVGDLGGLRVLGGGLGLARRVAERDAAELRLHDELDRRGHVERLGTGRCRSGTGRRGLLIGRR